MRPKGFSKLLFAIPFTVLAAALLFFGVKLFLGRDAEEKAPVSVEKVEAEPLEEIPRESPEEEGQEETASEEREDLPGEAEQTQAEDPQEQIVGEEEGAEADMSEVQTGAGENANVTIGIDVARYQGVIDWQQEAAKNGIKIGAYFFSTAVSEAEAKEEADWTADYIFQYQITYPVAYNCEGYSSEGSRQFGLDRAARIDAALAFLDRISERGYTPMFYAAKNEMEGDRDWDVSAISAK